MTFKKMKLVSNDICYGPMPEPDTEVEQHLTINEKGQVWFSRYRFGDGFGKYQLIKKEILYISQEAAGEIMKIANEVLNDQNDLFVTDVGVWELIATDFSGKETHKSGSLIYGGCEAIDRFCRLIREALKRNDLFLMDGGQQIGNQ